MFLGQQLILMFLDQQLISNIATHLVLLVVGAMSSKKLKVPKFQINTCRLMGVQLSILCYNFKMAGMTSFHAENCHYLASEHKASVCAFLVYSSACQFLICSIFLFVNSLDL